MPYIKSTFIGLFTIVIATIAYVLIAAVFLRRHPASSGTEVGFVGPIPLIELTY
jgi:hypothetical protein